MTASCVLSNTLIRGGSPIRNPLDLRGMEIVKRATPNKAEDMYYCYYATQAMLFTGGEAWNQWNQTMRDQLIRTQKIDGSWFPEGDRYGKLGGRLMCTSLCLLTLEVYYRYDSTMLGRN